MLLLLVVRCLSSLIKNCNNVQSLWSVSSSLGKRESPPSPLSFDVLLVSDPAVNIWNSVTNTAVVTIAGYYYVSLGIAACLVDVMQAQVGYHAC
jgi:hypothetical protein